MTKSDGLQPPPPARPASLWARLLLLACSDAGLYFCLFVIIVSGQFWVLFPPICFVAAGSGQFSFFNVCGMGWGWGWDISCLTASPCPAVGKAGRILPWAACPLCVCLSRPHPTWAAGPGTWCTLSAVPHPKFPLVQVARQASEASFLGEGDRQTWF